MNNEANQQRHIREMQEAIEALRKQMPTPEELAYLRQRKTADERVAWLLDSCKKHLPWFVPVLSFGGGLAYWVIKQIAQTGGPK
jgi:hypothetical protein